MITIIMMMRRGMKPHFELHWSWFVPLSSIALPPPCNGDHDDDDDFASNFDRKPKKCANVQILMIKKLLNSAVFSKAVEGVRFILIQRLKFIFRLFTTMFTEVFFWGKIEQNSNFFVSV